jgi:hypothetical protein
MLNDALNGNEGGANSYPGRRANEGTGMVRVGELVENGRMSLDMKASKYPRGKVIRVNSERRPMHGAGGG